MPDSTYDRLISPIEGAMANAIWRILRNRDDVDDALHDVLAKIWNDLGTIEQHPNPHALIIRICTTTAIDHLRKRIRKQHREGFELPPQTAVSGATAETAVAQEIRTLILNAVAQMPAQQATAITMRVVDDEPYEVISEVMGCSAATARTHVKRGREKLQQLLQTLNPVNAHEVKQ